MTATAAILAIDAGQSSIRARLLRGEIVEGRWDFPPILTDRPLLPQLVDVVLALVPERPTGPVRVAAALSGLTPADADPEAVLRACQDRGVTAVYLTHDSISGYLGCLGDRLGSALAAGTGVVTLATGESSFARVDGWGNIMGDAGSGYWIGRTGLDAAMRAHDGRGEPTKILGLIQQDFPDVESAYIEIQSNPERIALVASYARQIIDLSDHDLVSRRIVEQAIDELTLSITASLARVGWLPGSSPDISWVGKILSNPRMEDRLRDTLRQAWPNANLVAPRGGPLDGVAQIPALRPGHPLHPQIHVSTVASLHGMSLPG
ncbi:N-acetylglucosamine kinase [Arthrobacter sp. 35W]|uniref:N-acetylglucosamine kinase n=1 Tax=Arthrobacter sp. 35W TaxID=1132441 RepID=UPI0004263053|nr:BadF/BadG/BcrA/BcrD ATPase family protein [Arthrobacter sp. 35W]